jgi:type IV pilus assembly protein PilM
MFGLKRKKAAYGMHIMDNQIKLVEIESSSQQIDVLQRHIIALDEGNIKNGKLLDEESVIYKLTHQVKTLGLQGMPVHLTIPTSNVILRKSVFPDLKDQELRNMIDVELNGGSQVPFKNPVFDFFRLGHVQTEAAAAQEGDGKKGKAAPQEEVLVFATPLDIVEGYSSLVSRCGLTPVSVDIAPLALLRILARQQQLSGTYLPKVFMFLQAEPDYADISIFVQGVPVFLRSIQMNAGYLMDSGTEKIDAYGRNLSMELGRILNYFKYSVSSEQEEVERIYLIGESDWTAGLPALLENAFSGEITTFPLDRVLRVNDQTLHAYTVPLGLAMKGV